MGAFVDFLSGRFANLKNNETTILTANISPLVVESLRITNRTDSIILINLKNIRNEGSIITTYEENAYPIQPRDRIDLVKERGFAFNLQFSTVPAVSESLTIFSNGYSQIFDCNISYNKLNDLPPTP